MKRLLVILCVLMVPGAVESRPIHEMQRGVLGLGGAAAITYDLNAPFTSANDACANAQEIGSDPCGDATAITAGSIQTVETGTGTVAITSNAFVCTGSGTADQTGLKDDTAIVRAIGETFLFTTTPTATTTLHVGGVHSSSALSQDMEAGVELDASANINYQDGATDIDTGVNYSAQKNEFALVVGGYDGSAIPYKTGDAAANFTEGAALFHSANDGSWELLWKDADSTSANVYPTIQTHTAAAIVFDTLLHPTDTLEALLQPNSLDTFTDSNGTNLTAHTMDVDPQGATGWTSKPCLENEVWDIDTNTVELETVSDGSACNGNDDRHFVYVDSGESDIVADVNITCEGTNGKLPGLMFRAKADTAGGENLWMFGFNGMNECDWLLLKYVDGAGTTVEADTGFNGAKTTYAMRVIADTQSISGYIDGVAVSAQVGQSDLQTETWTGLFEFSGLEDGSEKAFDNFAVWPRGTGGEYDTTLDAY